LFGGDTDIRLHDRLVAGDILEGSVLTEARDRAVHDAGGFRVHGCPVESYGFGSVCGPVDHEDVGSSDVVEEHGTIARHVKVEFGATLAPVEYRVLGPEDLSQRIPTRRLDPQDICPVIREQSRRSRSGESAGTVDDPEAFERCIHVLPSSQVDGSSVDVFFRRCESHLNRV
jgi:hypothetical protein